MNEVDRRGFLASLLALALALPWRRSPSVTVTRPSRSNATDVLILVQARRPITWSLDGVNFVPVEGTATA